MHTRYMLCTPDEKIINHSFFLFMKTVMQISNKLRIWKKCLWFSMFYLLSVKDMFVKGRKITDFCVYIIGTKLPIHTYIVDNFETDLYIYTYYEYLLQRVICKYKCDIHQYIIYTKKYIYIKKLQFITHRHPPFWSI